jgi:hypothetical protein
MGVCGFEERNKMKPFGKAQKLAGKSGASFTHKKRTRSLKQVVSGVWTWNCLFSF